jgi:hypothetical protein
MEFSSLTQGFPIDQRGGVPVFLQVRRRGDHYVHGQAKTQEPAIDRLRGFSPYRDSQRYFARSPLLGEFGAHFIEGALELLQRGSGLP